MCRGYFYSQEIDPHHATEHRSTDQSRNGCGMCCFCHAQPFEITRAKNIKGLLGRICGRFADRVRPNCGGVFWFPCFELTVVSCGPCGQRACVVHMSTACQPQHPSSLRKRWSLRQVE